MIRRRVPVGLRRRDQRGSALVAAVAMVAIMAVLGMAMLAVVDVQTAASNRERAADRAFNLAEAVVNLQARVFGAHWPETLPLECEGSITGPGAGTATDSPYCADAALVAGSLTGADLSGSSWRMTATDLGDERIRVRVSASTVGPEASDRAVEAVIATRSAQAVPAGYSIIANNFSGELGLTVNQVTNISLLRLVLGDHRLVQGGKIALRCGLLNGALQPGHDPNICVTGALSLAGPNGLGGLGSILGLQSIVNYGYDTAATPAVMASLRSQAEVNGTLRTAVAHNAQCLPAGTGPDDIVYIDRVGSGDGTCLITLPAGTTTRVGAVIVENGRIEVRGQGSPFQVGVLRGVVWGMNRQAIPSGDLITIRGAAQVRGAVIADGTTGTVGLRPGLNPGSAEAAQADGMAEDLNEAEEQLGGISQEQINTLAALIAEADAKRAAVEAARTKTPYPQRSCPILLTAPDHGPLINSLTGLANALDAVIAAAAPLPGTASYVADLTAERNKVIAQRDALPNPATCVLLGLDQILGGLLGLVGGLLVGVVDLLLGPNGLLAYVVNLVDSLIGTINTLVSNLGTLLTDVLGGLFNQGMVVYEPEVIAGLRAHGAPGIEADSFRQVAAD